MFSSHTACKKNVICVWLASRFSLCVFKHEVTQQEIYMTAIALNFYLAYFCQYFQMFLCAPDSLKMVQFHCILINPPRKKITVSQAVHWAMCVEQQALRFRLNSLHQSNAHYSLKFVHTKWKPLFLQKSIRTSFFSPIYLLVVELPYQSMNKCLHSEHTNGHQGYWLGHLLII